MSWDFQKPRYNLWILQYPRGRGSPSSCGNAKISDLLLRALCARARSRRSKKRRSSSPPPEEEEGSEECQYCPFSLRRAAGVAAAAPTSLPSFPLSRPRLSVERKIWNRLRRILLSGFEFTFISRRRGSYELAVICTLQELGFADPFSPFFLRPRRNVSSNNEISKS